MFKTLGTQGLNFKVLFVLTFYLSKKMLRSNISFLFFICFVYFCLNCLLFYSVYIYVFYIYYLFYQILILFIAFINENVVYDISYLRCLCLHYTQIYNLCQSENLVKKYRINDISFKQLEFYKLVKPNPREVREFIVC